MTYNYQIQTYIKQNACTYTCVFFCYMRTCMDPGIFARVVGGPSPTGRKERWQLFSPRLILQWGAQCLLQRNYNFPESKQGGGVKNVRRSNFFQGDGTQLLFSIELVVFQGVPDSLYPLWIRAVPMCTCLCLWPFKVTKNKACSKFFIGIDV